MKLNEFIKQKRQSKALTVQQLADVLELSRSQMNRLESGESTFSLKHLHKIAETLNTDFYELVVLLVKEETGTILPLTNAEFLTMLAGGKFKQIDEDKFRISFVFEKYIANSNELDEIATRTSNYVRSLVMELARANPDRYSSIIDIEQVEGKYNEGHHD